MGSAGQATKATHMMNTYQLQDAIDRLHRRINMGDTSQALLDLIKDAEALRDGMPTTMSRIDIVPALEREAR